MRLGPACVGVCLAATAAAQQGDRQGEAQAPLPESVVVPAAVVRSPAEELATFRLQSGLRIELAASEPMVGDPVAAVFDGAWRLWVVEMRGYMNDVDAGGEHAPNGRIVVLHDKDSDGVFDGSAVFLDGLVLPRAVLPLRGGALVLEPPDLFWCPDADGDLRADAKQPVMGGFEAGLANPEHSGNGLLWGLDHRIHLAGDRRMLRWTKDGFRIEAGAGGGQWGISHDDRGRLYFNYNEDWLRCDLVPGRHGAENPDLGALPGLNHRLVPDTSVWPIRITPGVNRGYQPGRLRDWVLAIHTAVCAPCVYRGDVLPGCDGDVFVCEPAGHVVRRFELFDENALMRGENVYQREKQEFLASTDERFRPVNLTVGPDGALYVVDMYRGVIQHRNFVTTFLRRQILDRALERPIGLGRIWRIVPPGNRPPPRPPLLDAPVSDLVAALQGDVGAVRDLALKELVQRGERGAAPALRAALREHDRAACRIVLLSALHGLQELTATDVRFALHDRDAGVLGFALQHGPPFLGAGDGHLWTQVEACAAAGPPAVAWHAALALTEVLRDAAAARRHARAIAGLAALLADRSDDATLRGIVAVAAQPRQLAVLEAFVARLGDARSDGAAAALHALARAITRGRQEQAQQALFEFAAARPAWQRQALLRGALDALPKPPARHGWLSFAATPKALSSIVAGGDAAAAPLATELLAAIALRDERAAVPDVELTAEESARFAAGQRVFAAACAACHQLDGTGMPGLAPPLRESEWVGGPAERLLRIVLGGVKGPIEVSGTVWTLEMAAQRHLSDADVAAAATYVRRSFGNRGTPVTAAEAAAVREATKQRQEPWTAEELLGTK